MTNTQICIINKNVIYVVQIFVIHIYISARRLVTFKSQSVRENGRT
nr:MAG TPA: hypothetical protein [Inoviridae sp.]